MPTIMQLKVVVRACRAVPSSDDRSACIGVKPLVSVGIPVHNGVPLIERTMRTIRGQTYANLEILVSDNGSTDGTPEVLGRHAAEDERVHVEPLDVAIGIEENFEQVFRRARGEYFMWASHDDDWDLDFVERLVAVLEEDEAAALAAAVAQTVDVEGNVLGTQWCVLDLEVKDRLDRLVAFIEQPESEGKSNLMYSLFRRADLAAIDDLVGFLREDPRREDYHILLAVLIRGHLRVDQGLRFRKTIPPLRQRSSLERVRDGLRNTRVAANWIAAYPQVIEERLALSAHERRAIARATRSSRWRYYRIRARSIARTLTPGVHR
jgi:glycosyltransferase involved in cell wall biosynthesis